MKESQFQSKTIKLLKSAGWLVLNISPGGYSSLKGCPDLVCCYDGRFIGVELKVDNNQMSEAQVVYKKLIERSGGSFYSPRTIKDIEKIIENERKIKENNGNQIL